MRKIRLLLVFVALLSALFGGGYSLRQKPVDFSRVQLLQERVKGWIRETFETGRSAGAALGRAVSDPDKPDLEHAELQFLYAGIPKRVSYPNELQTLVYPAFLLGYDNNFLNSAWAATVAIPTDKTRSDPRPDSFFPDDRAIVLVPTTAYSHTGYHRGHLIPNYLISVCYGRIAQIATFSTTNVSPMTPRLNTGIWADLESRVARNYRFTLEKVWIITGPVFGRDSTRLPSGVLVPVAFYKILVDEDAIGPRALAFVIPQKLPRSPKLRNYIVSVDDVERLTGLDFLPDLPDDIEEKIESIRPKDIW